MRTIKTYFKGAPFYNAFIRTYPRLEGWEGSLRQIADLGASKGDLAHKET